MEDERPAKARVRYPARIRVDDEVVLSVIQERDAADIFELTNRNRQYLREWLPWVDTTQSVADTRAFLLRSLEQVRQSDGFQTRIDYRGQLAGMIGHHYHDWVNKRTEIGYWLSEPLQGRGIMTRACRTLTDFAFDSLGLNRVEIRVATDNQRSRAIPEHLGFSAEGVLREVAWLNNRFVDLVVYAKLAKERGAAEEGVRPRP
jgi:ribosomal-protein-serine acetyltransferase